MTTTRQEVCRYAAARLRGLLAEASPVPWRTSGPSSRYGGIIADARPQTPADEVEGYGGELIAESVLAGNGNLLLALSSTRHPRCRTPRCRTPSWCSRERSSTRARSGGAATGA